MWLLINNIYMKKFRDGWAEKTHAYHAIREKLRHQWRHPGRALDLKAKDLIGHLWVYLIIDQLERLVCYVFLHQSIIFNFNFLHSKNFTFLHCLGLIDMLSANQNGEIFSNILLVDKWRNTNHSAACVPFFCTLVPYSAKQQSKPTKFKVFTKAWNIMWLISAVFSIFS